MFYNKAKDSELSVMSWKGGGRLLPLLRIPYTENGENRYIYVDPTNKTYLNIPAGGFKQSDFNRDYSEIGLDAIVSIIDYNPKSDFNKEE